MYGYLILLKPSCALVQVYNGLVQNIHHFEDTLDLADAETGALHLGGIVELKIC